jgi:hypothetical protein
MEHIARITTPIFRRMAFMKILSMYMHQGVRFEMVGLSGGESLRSKAKSMRPGYCGG